MNHHAIHHAVHHTEVISRNKKVAGGFVKKENISFALIIINLIMILLLWTALY
jgi:hypothetical protein